MLARTTLFTSSSLPQPGNHRCLSLSQRSCEIFLLPSPSSTRTTRTSREPSRAGYSQERLCFGRIDFWVFSLKTYLPQRPSEVSPLKCHRSGCLVFVWLKF